MFFLFQALMDKSIETSNVNPNCPDYWVSFKGQKRKTARMRINT